MAAKKKYESDEKLADQLAEALTELPDEWIMCRDVRHAWEVKDDYHVIEGKGLKVASIRRTLICLRCKTLRVEHYHSLKWGLDKVSQNYVYPDHYQIHGVPRGVKPSYIVQGEAYRRTMERLAKVQKAGKKKAS